ncbi:MAG: Asp-tRNA(Asn)/Glu-tRNA(Gln) amidotransferase subunit GatB [Armatimonadetes bacterium]|nr:Asp-tRNA(Asn)/Glu-tRNA(Gln) amidotransferase subunit GatB [Armatimonadota bacterium]
MSDWVVSVGMEVHVELNTRSKMFCRCEVAFAGAPNTRVCPVCLGLPGALPVANREAVRKVIQTALALNCKIAENPLEVDVASGTEIHGSEFHRKNYFYPDLPKGYQISQYGETNPIGFDGYLEIPAKSGLKKVHIRRVHLEEDTGKLIHLPGGRSGVDYNRSGVPLMEIVTDFPPDITTAEEAKEYLVQLRAILRYLDVSDCRLEEGSMRCEPNISIRQADSADYGTKTELKNLNSFRAVQLGVEHEAERQAGILDSGGKVRQETRGWNESRLESFSQRVKEGEADYRYFPDPDLPPMRLEGQDIEELRLALPELPLAKSRRFQEAFGLSDYDAGLLVPEKDWAAFFEEAVALGGDPKAVCNWMNAELAMFLNADGLEARDSNVTPHHLVELTKLIASGQISGKMAKDVFRKVFETGDSPDRIVRESGLVQLTDPAEIEKLCREVIISNRENVQKVKDGQTGVLGFLIGQVMKLSQGRANPQIVQSEMRRLIESE